MSKILYLGGDSYLSIPTCPWVQFLGRGEEEEEDMNINTLIREIEDGTFLRVREVARRLAVSRGTVYNLISSGELLSVRVRGSRRVPAVALQEFIVAAMEDSVAELEERGVLERTPDAGSAPSAMDAQAHP